MEAHDYNRIKKYWSFSNVLMCVRIMLKNGLLTELRWFFPFLLVGAACGYEAAATEIMDVIGDFYYAISDADFQMFLDTLWRSIVVISVVSTLKSIAAFAQDACAIQWREHIVDFMHELYLQDNMSYKLIMGQGTKRLENPDQRITQDADRFTTDFAYLVRNSIVVPGLIGYYSWYLWTLFGWVAPAACFVYFIAGALVNGLLIRRLLALIYMQEKWEGDFRHTHAWNRVHVEQIAFLRGQQRERARVSECFSRVAHNRRLIVMRQLPLYLATNWFDYLGSIVNYAAVGLGILYLHKTSNSSSSDRAALLSEGSYSCLYLINAFSTLFDCSQKFSEVAGYTARISEMLIAMNFTPQNSKRISYFHYGSSPPSPRNPGSSAWGWSKLKHGLAVFWGKWGASYDSVPALSKSGESYFGSDGTRTRRKPSFSIASNDKDAEVDGLLSKADIHSNSGIRLASDEVDIARPLLRADIIPHSDSSLMTIPFCHETFSRESDQILHPNQWSTVDTTDGQSQTNYITHSRPDAFTYRSSSTCPHEHESSVLLTVENLTIANPDGQTLVRDLNFSLSENSHLLVCGASGIGKTSLTRVLAGLWPATSGHICVPHAGTRIFYLPQDPYVFEGSLVDQITYPYVVSDFHVPVEGAIEKTLLAVRLSHLLCSCRQTHPAGCVCGLSRVCNWAHMLSGGEQQRLGVARALFHAPDVCVCDESTSQVGECDEDSLYDHLRRVCMCTISLGHRASLERFCTHKLVLKERGLWEYATIDR